jgi:hypothetical protein
MRALVAALLLSLAALAGCEKTLEPSLVSEGPLLVGQTVSVLVKEGGDGSDLDEKTFELEAGTKTYEATSTELEVKKVSAKEISFAVPAGVPAGKATLSVGTSQGAVFSGEVDIYRLAAVRDLAGKVWLLALTGGGKAIQFAEAPLGAGFGHVSIGYNGRLLASLAKFSREVRLAWLGTPLSPSKPYAFDSTVELNGLVVTRDGLTLVATSGGTYAIFKPTSNPPGVPSVSPTPLSTGDTLAVAADSSGTRAVAASLSGSSYSLALIDLSSSSPAVLDTLPLTWTAEADARVALAISPDGKKILFTEDKSDQVALFVEGASAAVETSLPAGEQGPVAAASSADGNTFYIANGRTDNLTVVDVSQGTLEFKTPLSLSSGGAKSGAPVAIAASTHEEVVVLKEHDLVLLYDGGASLTSLTFPNLFQSGEVGATVAIQP